MRDMDLYRHLLSVVVALLLALGFAGLAQAAPGDLDPSFGTDGKVTTVFGADADMANALALQADGKIVVAGYVSDGTNSDFALARYKPNGRLDPTFGTGGMIATDFGSYDQANALALQADGKIVVAGSSYSPSTDHDFALARYNPDGSLDPTFGPGGKVTTDLYDSTDGARTLSIQLDGKIVVAGFSSKGSGYDFTLVRYTTDGSLDTTFGADGMVSTDFSGDYDYAHALALQADGKVVVAGSSNSDFALARYLGDAEAGPVLSVSPRALNFGRVEVGTAVDKSFTVENTGGGALTGNATTAAPFSIVESSFFSLGEGQSQEVVVRFSPSSTAFSLGIVSVSSDGGNASVSLIGKGK